ncbi:hypothetical protein NEMIN01_1723 [Nematocida minor]|uniref:uncharacterized protein n=1 Tax=Nematocida minor TaxID=1912983 RepID=UPI00222051BA|nr:uncharacterized protein NEMIN01_1723 [Nematocida minor]KAI5191905.1 hypothetical protein NEMIN01_1723 [Nematocida minor]
MADAQPTWKERVEKYRKTEEQWKRKPQGHAEVILEIVKETSVPALEAGLAAIIPLAKSNALHEYTKDVLSVVYKNIASTKPTMKKMIRTIVESQARYKPSLVVMGALPYIRDKNPKIVAETVKTLADHSSLLKEHLMAPVLPHVQFLFGHSVGAVREEATRLFQILAVEDPERIGEAVKSLRPIQIKEIFQTPENTEKEASQDTQEGLKTESKEEKHQVQTQEALREQSTSRNSSQSSQGKAGAAGNSAITRPNAESANSSSKETAAKKKKTEETKEVKEYRVRSLPNEFYERFASAQWKERLVMEELDELLGETGKLSRNDTFDVIDAVMKKTGESNNKVFIAAMSVVAKIAYREKVQEPQAVHIVKAVGKRLKDKKEQVQQSVTSLIVELLKMYKVSVLSELSNMAVSDKTLRHGVLKTLEKGVEIAGEKDIEDSKTFKALVACTKDQSADIRSLACLCISKVLLKREEAPTQGEIEQYGVERLLAAKIEAQTEEMFKQKDEEITAIIESICEDIRNTSIKPVDPVTPIKPTGTSEHGNMCSSPIITQSLKKKQEMQPTQDKTPENIFADYPPVKEFAAGETGSMHRAEREEETGANTFMQYVMEGVVSANALYVLISTLGQSAEVDTRIIMVLSSVDLTEEMALKIREKTEGFEWEDSKTALVAEELKARVNRIIGEKSSFEEKCLFAALCDALMKGEKVPQEEIIRALELAEKRETILKENQALLIIKVAGEMEYMEVFEMLEKVFPISKAFTILISLSENMPIFINSIHFLLQKGVILPNSSIEAAVNNPRFISLLEKAGTASAQNILTILKKDKETMVYSPYAKKIRRSEDTTDINILLNDIIDQNNAQSKESLKKLEELSEESLSSLLKSASTVVNVLLLQLNDSLSSGGPSLNANTIIKIIKRICESDVFLSTLDAGTLMSLVSDYIVIITGQIPRGSSSPEGIKKECGESLLKMCINAPFLNMFKIYMNLLSNRYREEKVREILVKLLWKHSKISGQAVSDRGVVTGILARLNSFYTEFKGDIKSDQLISKVLQLHLIEILKYYGEDLLKLFKVSGPVLQQIHALGGAKI